MMRRIRLKQIAPTRCGITVGALQGLLSLIFVPVFYFMGGLAAYFEPAIFPGKPSLIPGVGWVFFGLTALFMPVLNGVLGFMGGVLVATVFNLVARWTGGIDAVIEDHE